MAKNLVVNGKTFVYPDAGDDPGWGESSSDWAKEVTDVLASLLTSGDILETSFTVDNNTNTGVDVTGLLFNGTVTRSSIVQYYVYRAYDDVVYVQTGSMYLKYNDSDWFMSHEFDGDASISFDVDSDGQVIFNSSPITGTGTYVGLMKFSAKSITVG